MDDLFPPQEYEARLSAVRAGMARRDVEIALISAPENIFYLTGLDHWGYFAPHLLIVPAEGELVLITRAMEKVTIANQVKNARFEGHSDSETVADVAIRELGRTRSRAAIGLEAWSSGLPHGLADKMRSATSNLRFVDISGLVDGIRLIKSPAEQALMRAAARVTDAAAAAAIETLSSGATEREIAAACSKAMIEAGGAYPGFGPFIRSTARLGEEHTTWVDTRLAAGDALFLELSGCVARYHAPLGRLIHVGHAPDNAHAMAELSRKSFDAVLSGLKDGARACDVYAAWQAIIDEAGLSHYRRHHCGYAVGIGVPPSWTGGNSVTGLRHDSGLVIRGGMTFHILSWLMDTGRGDFFISNTVLVGENGPEVLTVTPGGVTVR